jgi:threonine/homoserine/homoserine lactone efflux protein
MPFAPRTSPRSTERTSDRLFACLLAGVGFVAVSSWALSGNLFRSFLSKYERLFNWTMAALLVYTAAASLFTGR